MGEKNLHKNNSLQLSRSLKSRENEITKLKLKSGPLNEKERSEIGVQTGHDLEYSEKHKMYEDQIEVLKQQIKSKDESIVTLVASYRQLKRSLDELRSTDVTKHG